MLRLLLLALIPLMAAPALASNSEGFVALCYHDVRIGPEEAPAGDAPSISAPELADHFDWLKKNDYRVIGVDDILRARSGGPALPPRSVLLTFDDGYLGFYHAVYPLLRAYNYKALLALETGRLESQSGRGADNGDRDKTPRSHFLTWPQVKEMADSGLVETASKSHDLHRTHLSTPQGVRQPAAVSRSYDPASKTYESKISYYQRVKDDFARSAGIIARRTGHRPRVAVWPYGLYTGEGVKAAQAAGYALTASMDVYSEGPTFPRLMVREGMNFTEAMAAAEAGLIPGHSGYGGPNFEARHPAPFAPKFPFQRVIEVDPDLIFDPDPVRQEKNISALFDRILALRATVVYLRAWSDADGDGRAEALYFPSRHLPMRADLFNYLAWQISRRLGAKAYASLPVLAFDIQGRPAASASGEEVMDSAARRRIIREIYEDLASHAVIDGIVFHDDAFPGGEEDAGPYFGHSFAPDLTAFTLELAEAAEGWSKKLKTVRLVEASALSGPGGPERAALRLDDFMAAYDYVAIAVGGSRKDGADADRMLKNMAEAVKPHPLGARKTVFVLKAADRRQAVSSPVNSRTLAARMRLLRRQGFGHYGYGPEDPAAGHPEVRVIQPVFSLNANPFSEGD